MALLATAFVSFYALSIGPVFATRLWYRGFGELPSNSIDTTIDIVYYPVMVVSDSIGIGWHRSWYLLQWYGYVWPIDLWKANEFFVEPEVSY